MRKERVLVSTSTCIKTVTELLAEVVGVVVHCMYTMHMRIDCLPRYRYLCQHYHAHAA